MWPVLSYPLTVELLKSVTINRKTNQFCLDGTSLLVLCTARLIKTGNNAGLVMKILIAEDDRELSRLAELLLRSEGYDVVKAVDASQILSGAQREKPELILLDINMPGGNGKDILIKLKRSSLTAHIQVVVVSSESDPKLHAFVKQEGAEGFLQKPWAPETYIQELKKLAPHLPW